MQMNISYKKVFLFLMLVLRADFLNADSTSDYYRKQIPQLQTELSSKPDDIKRMDRLGYAYARTQQYDKAMQMWENILKTKKRDPYMGVGIIDGLMAEKQYEKAENVLSQYFEFFPKQAWARYDHGVVNYFNRNYKKALQEFETCLRIEPAHSGAHYWLGRVHYTLGDKEKAIKEFLMQARTEDDINGGYSGVDWNWVAKQTDILSSLKPKTFEEILGVGIVFAKAGQGSKAFELLEKARKMSPNNAAVYFNLGQYYSHVAKDYGHNEHRGNIQKKIFYYGKAAKLGYSGQPLYIWIADYYYSGMGDYQKAADYYLKSIEEGQSADYAEDYLLKKGYYADNSMPQPSQDLIRRVNEAKEKWRKKEEKRIAKIRSDPVLKKKLTDIRKEKLKKIEEQQQKTAGEYEDPFYLAFFKEIIMLSTLFIALVIILFKLWYPLYLFAGNGHFKAGRYEEAAGYYEKLLAIRNGKYVPFSKLKEIYLKTGRRDEKAIHVFEKIYKENPEDKEVITVLANAYAKQQEESVTL